MNILLVDDDHQSRKAVGRFLCEMGHTVTEFETGEQALENFPSGDFPMVLSDIKMPGMTGIDLAEAISKLPFGELTDVVLFTGYGDIDSAIAALRAGAYDYITKPIDAAELAAVVDRIAEHQLLRRENKKLTDNLAAEVQERTAETRQEIQQIKKVLARITGLDLIGVFSGIMHDLIEEAKALHLDRTLPVLIEGETGTGKEILARLVHFGDLETEHAQDRPFIDLNCAAINSNLFESELFGYEAGAYTNATPHGQKGKLDLAQEGTLFLDEIGELSGEVQAKLLRVLQEKQYYRVGGLKKISTDARIICATNMELEKRVQNGHFRADLYYRLCVGRLRIPPLRERRQEIIPLAELFLKDFSRRRKKCFRGISPEAAILLADYHWPGNIRELKNLIEIVVFKFNDVELSKKHLIGLLEVDDEIISSPANQEIVLPFPAGGFSLKDYNTLLIQKILAAHNNNRSAAARYLGISRRALLYKLERTEN